MYCAPKSEALRILASRMWLALSLVLLAFGLGVYIDLTFRCTAVTGTPLGSSIKEGTGRLVELDFVQFCPSLPVARAGQEQEATLEQCCEVLAEDSAGGRFASYGEHRHACDPSRERGEQTDEQNRTDLTMCCGALAEGVFVNGSFVAPALPAARYDRPESIPDGFVIVEFELARKGRGEPTLDWSPFPWAYDGTACYTVYNYRGTPQYQSQGFQSAALLSFATTGLIIHAAARRKLRGEGHTALVKEPEEQEMQV